MENEEMFANTAKNIGIAALVPKLMLSIVLLLIGLFILFVNCLALFHSFSYIETEATVIDIRYEEESGWYIPVYEFYVGDEIVKAEGLGGTDKEMYSIGDKKIISYNPDNYKQFDEVSSKDSWIFWLISIVLLLVSIGYICKFIKIIKKSKDPNCDTFETLNEIQELNSQIEIKH